MRLSHWTSYQKVISTKWELIALSELTGCKVTHLIAGVSSGAEDVYIMAVNEGHRKTRT